MDNLKRECKLCREVKDLTVEFFMSRISKGKSYFGYKCRLCENKDCQKYHAENRNKELLRMKEYRIKNKCLMKKYREEHKNEAKEYRLKNKEKNREYYRNRQKEKLKNPIYRLHSNMSKSIHHHLKKNNLNKNKKTWIKFVDYTVEELKIHLEKQFKDGMNWENYGKWHIDHIKPKSLFNITSVECIEFKKCWSLENLQPLWAIDNISKGNRFVG